MNAGGITSRWMSYLQQMDSSLPNQVRQYPGMLNIHTLRWIPVRQEFGQNKKAGGSGICAGVAIAFVKSLQAAEL